jgi:formylglycine-generating enzyme required for sulfatase activity
MPKHNVAVPGFFMSKYEITQRQWRAVMNGKMPAGFQSLPQSLRDDDLPIISVTWSEAEEFCNKLTNDETGRFYRLPSEAEWEYAAKAGKDQNFGYGNNINSSVANYFAAAPFGHDRREQNRLTLLAAGNLKAANPFGLYDMHGNVAEWTADVWNDDYSGAPDDGSAWEESSGDNQSHRVIRGGGWDSIGNDCRSAARRRHPAVVASPKIGFRIVFRQD